MLSNLKLKKLKPKGKPYQVFDGGGLCVEVLPSGRKVWRLRYRIGGKPEKLTLGSYPAVSLTEARRAREEAKLKIEKGVSPCVPKRTTQNLEAFSRVYLSDVVGEGTEYTKQVRRILAKDLIPFIGTKRLEAVTASDVLAITDRIKARGSYAIALSARNVLKRLFDYAITRQLVQANPAAAVAARYIAIHKPRTRVLSRGEISRLLEALRLSRAHPAHRIAIHLLLLTMVRKSELVGAKWQEIDFERCEWTIPAERMKKEKPHVVYLAAGALELFEKLKPLSCGSDLVFPTPVLRRGSGNDAPIHGSTLNRLVKALGFCDFTLHDFRRTASTHLHEAGFNSDWIEKALAHEKGGICGIYNKAEYSSQRRDMLAWWADFVDLASSDKVVLLRPQQAG